MTNITVRCEIHVTCFSPVSNSARLLGLVKLLNCRLIRYRLWPRYWIRSI